MRVTQFMLSNNMLRNLSNSFERLGKLQDQLSTGKKINRPSDDPVVAMKGIFYRTQVEEIKQYKRNLSEVFNWQENADEALDKATNVMQRIRELAVQASNDTYEATQRKSIAQEIRQLREHLVSIANTKLGEKFIFNGTDTATPPVNLNTLDAKISAMPKFSDLTVSGSTVQIASGVTISAPADYSVIIEDSNGKIHKLDYTGSDYSTTDPTFSGSIKKIVGIELSQTVKDDLRTGPNKIVSDNVKDVEIEVSKGIYLPVNVKPTTVFTESLFENISRLVATLEDSSAKGEQISAFLDELDKDISNMVNTRTELGARQMRANFVESRVDMQEVIANRIMSDNEDAEIERVITDLKTQESVHRAALGVGARIIQPSLLDFLR
jgi:flagellar hook-associated protein 3 FlgL